MKKYGFLTLILCLFCLGEAAVASPGKADAAPAAQAQSSKLTVKGFVKDDKGDPMIGVTLIVKGTNFGTVSNADGSYSIDVPYGGATLMVSYIGYAPQEINVNNRTKIDITLLDQQGARRGRRRGLQRPRKRRRSPVRSPRSRPKTSNSRPRPTSTTRWPDVCRVCW